MDRNTYIYDLQIERVFYVIASFPVLLTQMVYSSIFHEPDIGFLRFMLGYESNWKLQDSQNAISVFRLEASEQGILVLLNSVFIILTFLI